MGTSRSTQSVLSLLPASPASVPEARNVVASLAANYGASWNDLERIRLIVSEAVTNVVVHAYEQPGDGGETVGNVHVTAAVIGSELTVVVADDGCGLGGAAPSPGLGLGLGLVANECDSFSIVARPYGGTQLEMRVSLGEGSREEQHPAQTPAAEASGRLLSFEGR